jgi:biopolymer transport protein ExbB
MESTQALGFGHYIAHADAISKGIFIVLIAMSIASWYLVIVKSVQAMASRRRSRRFLAAFWDAPSLEAVERGLEEHHPDDPFSHVAYHAIVSSRHHGRLGANRLNESGTMAEFLTRAIRRVIDEETARLEWGLSVLASVGSTAPFVGLFGTVWGVYHALLAIGASGQGTLDKVAGPVGEALIMTGAGLAVAIPAVLAYNAFVRSNRVVQAQLDSFAHDIYAFLTTGSVYAREAGVDQDAGKRAVPQVVRGAA